MAKKKARGGAALRAKKRADAAHDEIVEQKASEVETQDVVSKPDDQLFVVDTTASRAVPRAELPQQPKKKSLRGKQDVGLLEKRQRQVRSLLDRHGGDAEKLAKLATQKPTRKRAAVHFDLWRDDDDDDEQQLETTTKLAPKPGIGSSLAGTAPSYAIVKAQTQVTRTLRAPTVAVEVAHSGQSYHPDPQKHQDVIGEALSLELRRKEAQNYKNAPISRGLKDETRALLVGDDDDDDDDKSSSDADESESNQTSGEVFVAKKKEKLTRAQRNKQKRVRAEEKAIRERKQAKQAMNAVHQVKRMKKEIEQKQQERRERKKWIAQAKQQEQRPLGKQVFLQRSKVDPIGAPTLPVALTDELEGSSLRTIKPKGSLLTDRMESYVDRKMAEGKREGKRKRIIQGKKRRRIKIKAKGHDIHVKDESGRDYLLMG